MRGFGDVLTTVRLPGVRRYSRIQHLLVKQLCRSLAPLHATEPHHYDASVTKRKNNELEEADIRPMAKRSDFYHHAPR